MPSRTFGQKNIDNIKIEKKKYKKVKKSKIEQDTKKKKKRSCKKNHTISRRNEATGEDNNNLKNLKKKLQYLYPFTDPSVDQNHHTGQAVGISGPLDNRVVE